MSLKICINGSNGRMGVALAEEAEARGHQVVGKVDVGDDLQAGMREADLVIDFSFHAATATVLETAARLGKAVICGTTGHTPEERARLVKAASGIGLIWAGNFSIGVNLLCHLVKKAAFVLSADYNAEIVEMHHRMKKDAPSGTAMMLAEAIMEARNLKHSSLRSGRDGIVGERSQDEVGMHSLRGGDVVGEHTVLFAGDGERIELIHQATDRRIFARGAVRAAEWLNDQPAGHYSISQALGLAE